MNARVRIFVLIAVMCAGCQKTQQSITNIAETVEPPASAPSEPAMVSDKTEVPQKVDVNPDAGNPSQSSTQDFEAAVVDEPKIAAAPNPIEIVFPTPRIFRHQFEIEIEKLKNAEIHKVLASADKGNVIFNAYIVANERIPKGVCLFHVSSRLKELSEGKGRELIFITDHDRVVLRCTVEQRIARGFGDLSDFVKLISASKLHVKIEGIEFDLFDRHLEGMRDLASRLSDGKSRDGRFNTTHAQDAASTIPFNASPDPGETPAEHAIAVVRHSRIRELQIIVDEINRAKKQMKQAMVADDLQTITTLKQTVARQQSRLRESIDAPMFEKGLDLYALREGDMGMLPEGRLEVLQVLNKSRGSALLHAEEGPRPTTIKVSGIDATNLVDGAEFRSKDVFCVIGTYEYETVAIGTKTIFELKPVSANRLMGKAERQIWLDAADPDYKIELTADEQAAAMAAHDVNETAAREKMSLKKDEEAIKQADAKVRRARSYLDSGKLLLKKENPSGARKQFEKAVAEDPECDAGKEAAKLLESLPGSSSGSKTNSRPEVVSAPGNAASGELPGDGDRSSAELDHLMETAASLVQTAKTKASVPTMKEAVLTLRKASNRYPKDLRGDFYLGILHSGIGINDAKTAEIHFKKVLDRSPGHLSTMNNLALVSIKADKFAQARNYLGLAGKQIPRPFEVNQNLGRLLNQSKLLEIKNDEIKRISELNTEPTVFRPDTGWVYMPLDDSDKSRDEYKNFCRDGKLEDPSCSVCHGYGNLPCKVCGHEGTVLEMGTMTGTSGSMFGSASTSALTSRTQSCKTCNGKGRVECPNCKDGRDPSLKR